MTALDELDRLAAAATHPWQFGRDFSRSAAVTPGDAAFIAAANPAVVQALIAAVRAADAVRLGLHPRTEREAYDFARAALGAALKGDGK